uniref:Uncharacterized protein n=1 Tax=Kalanchoe fedtschenkoi TaxID=63787 RepID=A0A7N1A247_KALFE
MPFLAVRRTLNLSRHRLLQLSRHYTDLPKSICETLANIPRRHRRRAIHEAQQALSDYLHVTRSLPFAHADSISRNSIHSLSDVISKIDFSVITTFSETFSQFLRYNPIDELGFFYESIGIDYKDVPSVLPARKFFITEEFRAYRVACVLSGFGFAWNRLGKLYMEEAWIFDEEPEELSKRLLCLKNYGFKSAAVVGMCLAFPELLGSGSEFRNVDGLLDDLKRVNDLVRFEHNDADRWYNICKNIGVFYGIGFERGTVRNLMDTSISVFVDYSNEIFLKSIEYFCELDVPKKDVVMLLHLKPAILGFDLETPHFSILELLKHFGMSVEELESVRLEFPYVLGWNEMANLPSVMRALDRHNWFFSQLNNGGHELLGTYVMKEPMRNVRGFINDELSKATSAKHPNFMLNKLNSLLQIGFGANEKTMKLLYVMHGSGPELQARFDLLICMGADHSSLCKALSHAPRILNQNVESIQKKVDFLFNDLGLCFLNLYQFPAFLCFSLENRIKPRIRFQVWLEQKGACRKKYCLSSIIAASERTFITRISLNHPAAPKHWFERFLTRNNSDSCLCI